MRIKGKVERGGGKTQLTVEPSSPVGPEGPGRVGADLGTKESLDRLLKTPV